MTRGTSELAAVIRDITRVGQYVKFDVGEISDVSADGYSIVTNSGKLVITKTLTQKISAGMEVLYMYTVDRKTNTVVGDSVILGVL